MGILSIGEGLRRIIPRFHLDGREHLKPVQVDPPDLSADQSMLGGGTL